MTYLRLITCIILAVILKSCSNTTSSDQDLKSPTTKAEPTYNEVDSFKTLINKAQVTGSILIFDVDRNTYFSNNFHWAKSGFLPASTYKIPNSIIALETGIMHSDSTMILWDGEKKRFKVWEQDLTLRDAFHYSCVPCYQDIARKVGVQPMNEYVDKLEYGKMDIDSTNLDLFWLRGNSKITQFEQIDFLKRFNTSQLPITNRTEHIMKDMMIITENDSMTIRGKTGWSNENSINNGWFVGYIERNKTLYYFATNIQPKPEVSLQTFAELRRTLTYEALEYIYNKK